jgi:hypothetical protein
VAADLGERWELLHIIPKMQPTPGFNLPVIELIKDMRRKHRFDPAGIESIQIAMNWLETSYPSPYFVEAQPGKPPRAGGTNYVAAYTCIHGDYPVLGLPPNQTSAEDGPVRDLMNRVEVLGVWDRLPFAPRITLRMSNGETLVGEYRGNELEWDFATEMMNLRPVFDSLDWPKQKLEGIVEAVTDLESLPNVGELIKLCVPS